PPIRAIAYGEGPTAGEPSHTRDRSAKLRHLPRAVHRRTSRSERANCWRAREDLDVLPLARRPRPAGSRRRIPLPSRAAARVRSGPGRSRPPGTHKAPAVGRRSRRGRPEQTSNASLRREPSVPDFGFRHHLKRYAACRLTTETDGNTPLAAGPIP